MGLTKFSGGFLEQYEKNILRATLTAQKPHQIRVASLLGDNFTPSALLDQSASENSVRRDVTWIGLAPCASESPIASIIDPTQK